MIVAKKYCIFHSSEKMIFSHIYCLMMTLKGCSSFVQKQIVLFCNK